MRYVICKLSFGIFIQGKKYIVHYESEGLDCDEQKFYFIEIDPTLKEKVSNLEFHKFFTTQNDWRNNQIKKILP